MLDSPAEWLNASLLLNRCNDEMPVARIAAGMARHILEQVKWHLQVVVHHRFFSNPV